MKFLYYKIFFKNGEPEAENISDDELPDVPVVKVPETEEVSDEELPGPKRAELPADTEVRICFPFKELL